MSIIEATTGHRHQAGQTGQETVLRRAQFLRDHDRMLIEMTLHGRASRREIARLVGVPAGTLSRRLQRLAKLLYDPLIVALLDKPGQLRDEVRQLGIEHFLHRRSTRDLADFHRMSEHEVCRIVEFIRGWFRGRGEH
ncbi:MAG TPA: winged helix-turn-helix domain-containing protein [Tepidisphaeraceae bacterium]|jgi:hypothetical protein